MIIAIGRDREAEYKENLHKIANVSIARAVNKGWGQTKAYDIMMSVDFLFSLHAWFWSLLCVCGIKWDVSDYNKDTAK